MITLGVIQCGTSVVLPSQQNLSRNQTRLIYCKKSDSFKVEKSFDQRTIFKQQIQINLIQICIWLS